MKRYELLLIAALLIISLPILLGSGGPPPKGEFPYLIDNFEDGNYDKNPEWYKFDSINLTIQKNSQLKPATFDVGVYSLNLSGSTSKWYVGGIGTMLGVESSKYSSLNIDIYGYGEGSGKLKIELYNNDSGKKEILVDKNFVPLYDDLWFYEIDVNWEGWKHFSIPFEAFKLANPGRGDGVFNHPLAKIQLICVAAKEVGKVNYNVDNIELGIK